MDIPSFSGGTTSICELARPRTPKGMDALIDAHHRYAGGESSILRADPDLYNMQRHGTEAQSLVYVLNNLGKSMERHFGEDQVDKPEVQTGGMGRS
jgi:hypothetical protein